MAGALDFKALLLEERRKASRPPPLSPCHGPSALACSPTQAPSPVTVGTASASASASAGASERPCHVSHQSADSQATNPCDIHSEFLSCLHSRLVPHAHIVGDIPSIYYIPEFICESDEALLLQYINATTDWTSLRTRKLLCFSNLQVGLTGSTARDSLRQQQTSSGQPNSDIPTGIPIPQWLHKCIDYLIDSDVFDDKDKPNHVLINSYLEDQGILHHSDGPRYKNRTAILSMASDCVMTFRRKLASDEIGVIDGGDVLQVVLRPRSLLVFTDSAYDHYMHGIAIDESMTVLGANGVPCINLQAYGMQPGDRVMRGALRTSMTFRQAIGDS